MSAKTNVYGDKLNMWHDVSFEKDDKEIFAYSTNKITIMYGIDLNEGGFFSAYTSEKHFMEFAPQKSFKHKSINAARVNALKILKIIN
jgi:hypothetical protein